MTLHLFSTVKLSEAQKMSTDSDTSSDDMFCQYDAVDALRHKPAPELFLEEIILKNILTGVLTIYRYI